MNICTGAVCFILYMKKKIFVHLLGGPGLVKPSQSEIEIIEII